MDGEVILWCILGIMVYVSRCHSVPLSITCQTSTMDHSHHCISKCYVSQQSHMSRSWTQKFHRDKVISLIIHWICLVDLQTAIEMIFMGMQILFMVLKNKQKISYTFCFKCVLFMTLLVGNLELAQNTPRPSSHHTEATSPGYKVKTGDKEWGRRGRGQGKDKRSICPWGTKDCLWIEKR